MISHAVYNTQYATPLYPLLCTLVESLPVLCLLDFSLPAQAVSISTGSPCYVQPFVPLLPYD